MNELDLVREVASDTPEPDAATTRAARARLLAGIAAETAAGGPAANWQRHARPARRTIRGRRLLPVGVAFAAVVVMVLAVPLILRAHRLHRPDPGHAGPGTWADRGARGARQRRADPLP